MEKQYTNAIGRAFGQTALLPGALPVTAGQVIVFKDWDRPFWQLREAVPQGAYTLADIVQSTELVLPEPESGSINLRYSNAPVNQQLLSDYHLRIDLQEPGDLYFLAIGCRTIQLPAIQQQLEALQYLKSEPWWKQGCLVTSVTIAKRALIVQAGAAGCSIELVGEVGDFINSGGAHLSGDETLTVRSINNAALAISWQENVPVLMETVPLYRPSLSRLFSLQRPKPTPEMIMTASQVLTQVIIEANHAMHSSHDVGGEHLAGDGDF